MTTDPDIIDKATRIIHTAECGCDGPSDPMHRRYAQALADAGLLTPKCDRECEALRDWDALVRERDEAIADRDKWRSGFEALTDLQKRGAKVREQLRDQRDKAEAERNEAQAEQDRLADIIKGLYETIDDERATIRKLVRERMQAQAALDRVRAAADTLTWQNDYGDAQQIIYAAIVGEDQS